MYQPFIWVLAALTMTVGNVLALRQTNIVRLLAYSSVSQGGFILMPLAVIATGNAAESALKSVVVYLLIYALLEPRRLRRRDRRQPQDAQRRDQLVRRTDELCPRLGRADDDLPRLAGGLPPLGIWIAKLLSFKTLLDAGGTSATCWP